MNQQTTTAIVLARTDYGEADRIVTVLTPDYGKLRLMAKGVRKVKSKLAGGIELFSVSHITFIRGRGDISTLISTRLIRHYGHIVRDIGRVQLGYELLKLVNRTTEDNAETEYFELLEHAFRALDDAAVPNELIRAWFYAQLLRLGGHTPNLRTDVKGKKLLPDSTYRFDYDTMGFVADGQGMFTAAHIKYLRLLFSDNQPAVLLRVRGQAELLAAVRAIPETMRNMFIRI